MKTKRNKKFVTNKRKKNKKLINKSFKKYRNNNKNFSRKYRQKGGARVYDSFQRNKKPLIECLSNNPIVYDPKKHDYVPTVSLKKFGTIFSGPNPNCKDTFKYYNTAKLTFGELKDYLYFYREYFNKFGKDAVFDLYKLGFLHIFHYLNDNKTDIPNLNFLFDSVSPILFESFVSNNPGANFFWEHYYFNKTALAFRENMRIIESKIKGVDVEETRLPFKIRSKYIDYITVKNPFRLVKIFEDYKPYYSPLEYIGITQDDGNDIVSSIEMWGNVHKFKVNNLLNIDNLLYDYRFIRNFNNVNLLSNAGLFENPNDFHLMNFKWDLIFDIPFDNNNLAIIHSYYNTNRDEDISSFFRDTFLRTRENIYIEKNGITYSMNNPNKNNIESIYELLLILSGLTDGTNYDYNTFIIEFNKVKENLRFDILKDLLLKIGFPEYNIELCFGNLTNYIKTYFLSKNEYLFNCLNIKTFVSGGYNNVYGVFSLYTDETKITTGQLQTNIDDRIRLTNVNNKNILIQLINNFVFINTNQKISLFAKRGDQANEISCAAAFYNVIENDIQKGYGANLFRLIGMGQEGQITLAHVIQVSIYSKNNNSAEIDEYKLKYLFIWNNKDNTVYDLIDEIEITQTFKDCFLIPIFENKFVPLQPAQINTTSASGGLPEEVDDNSGWDMMSSNEVETPDLMNKYKSPIYADPGLPIRVGVPVLGGKRNKTKRKIRKYKK
jgi:hypothetical protein